VQPRVAPEQRETVTLEDVRASHPVDRLLEDSWQTRSQRASRRELLVEAIAATLFLLAAAPLAVPAIAAHHLDPGLALMTVALYAIVAAFFILRGRLARPVGLLLLVAYVAWLGYTATL